MRLAPLNLRVELRRDDQPDLDLARVDGLERGGFVRDVAFQIEVAGDCQRVDQGVALCVPAVIGDDHGQVVDGHIDGVGEEEEFNKWHGDDKPQRPSIPQQPDELLADQSAHPLPPLTCVCPHLSPDPL